MPDAILGSPDRRQLGSGERAYLLLVLTMLMWGLNAVAGRLAIGQASPMTLTCARWFVVVAVLGIYARRDIIAERRLLAQHWRSIILFGALGFTVFNAIFYQAAHYTSAVNIGIVQGTMPVVVLIGSFLAYRTPIRRLQVLGLLVTLAGVCVVASRGDLDVLRRLDFSGGDLAILIATVFYGTYTVALKARPAMRPLAFFAGVAAAAFLTSVPLLGVEIALGRTFWPTPTGWLIVLFVGLFASLISQVMYLRSVEMIGPDRAGLFINLVPIFAALGGVVLLGEPIRPYHGAALFLVLGGIALSEWRRSA